MDYVVRDGSYYPDLPLSELEHSLFLEFENMLREKGFRYISVPSSIRREVLERQGSFDVDLAVKIGYFGSKEMCLTGSAEQGILDYFKDTEVSPMWLYAKNQCFRKEHTYSEVRLQEFLKLEQFVFCQYESDARNAFDKLLSYSEAFLKKYGIPYRVLDVTMRDSGYHTKKYDIEIFSKKWGWLETHSCTNFGQAQTGRFGITGANYTVSNTGIASPRILIPFIEGTATMPGNSQSWKVVDTSK